jgi:hypothetical protein
MQSPIFQLINNLLRLSRHPAEIYYIQPFFKDLFEAVNFLHQSSKKLKATNKPFIFYRGGLASQS